MTIDPANSTAPRLRRPLSPRTVPRRNILGVFKQTDAAPQSRPNGSQAAPVYSGPPPAGGHPLGLPTDDEAVPQDHITADFDHEAMQAASSVLDRHIEKGPEYTISTDTSGWKRLSSLSGSLDPKDIADLAKTLTQGYTAVAQSWVEMADKLRDVLAATTSAPEAAPASDAGPPAPTLCIQSPRRVLAKVQMFGTGDIQSVQQLAPEDQAQSGMIADVVFGDGQIDIHVPDTVAAGRYHGIILSTVAEPMGVVTVTVPSADDATP